MILDWNTWKPWYEKIVSDFGYDVAKDEESAKILETILSAKEEELSILKNLIEGKEVLIIGPVLPPDFKPIGDYVKVAAGSATSQLMKNGIFPDILVTDLDGDMEAQIEANEKGAIAVIHAHGDNVSEVREWVTKFKGPVIGTTQARPRKKIHNFGGFTDGDRAVFLALHFGARKVMLKGFDFDAPVVKNGTDIDVKKKKLAYAKRLINFASGHYNKEITY